MRDQGSGIRRQALRILAGTAVAVLALALTPRAQPAAGATDRVWFCPSPGSIDYLDLFTHPDEWPRARQLIDVFKFYQQHTQAPAPAIVGSNSYDALVRAGAFRMLAGWKKKIAIEAGSVKPFYCTPDASGMQESIANSLASIRAIQSAGGSVDYIAQDEPFVSGRERVCGGPALEPTADRVATYVAGVKAAFPKVAIGLIEAYPFSSADQIEAQVSLLQARGATPAFLHMDVDWHLSGADAFVRDMARLQAYAAAQHIPFGIIVTGYNGNADPLYAVDAYGITELIARTFQTWSRMPDQLIVQSWAATNTGLVLTPANLDEQRLFSHTLLLREVYRRLRGANGPSTGVAVPRTR
jgi:hypothetical protein